MDPFSAIGLASNILSFLDFGWTVVAEARAIYESDSGAAYRDKTIEAIAEDAQRLCADMVVHSPSGARELQELAKECQAAADELLVIIKKCVLPKEASRGRRIYHSFRLAFGRNLKDELDPICRRLQNLQLQLITRMNWMLLNENSEIVNSIKRIEECNQQMGVESKAQLTEMKTEIIEKLGQLESNTKSGGSIDEYRNMNASAFRQTSALRKDLLTGMSNLESNGYEASTLSLLLQSLHFDTIQARHDKIEEAHVNTFRWVLETHKDSGSKNTKFVEWLQSDRRMFWVCGKPGSGKSTLMKYLLQCPEIPEHLAAWAGSDRSVIAQYFFWNSGTPLQKSPEGLLRSLLFDIVRAYPEVSDIIQRTRQVRGVPACSLDDWNCQALVRAFEALSPPHVSIKLCLFIDGLDECKGDTRELLKVIQKLMSLGNVKMCVSSRPWTEFVDAFGSDGSSVIKLEDLTQLDIFRYVWENLRSNKRFQVLAKDDAAYRKLVTDVVFKANGVFLWVKLVVHSLLQGAMYADSLSYMQKRLEEFPGDLEAYYEAIVAGIPAIYLEKTSRTIQVMLAANRPMPLIMHYFIDELLSDLDFALKAEVRDEPDDSTESVSSQMIARLDGRFKGLLELRDGRVDFIHQTVKDFLRARFPVHDDRLVVFNPHSILCHSFLALAKWHVGDSILPISDPTSPVLDAALPALVKLRGMHCNFGRWQPSPTMTTAAGFVYHSMRVEDADFQSTKLDQAMLQISQMKAAWSPPTSPPSIAEAWHGLMKHQVESGTSIESAPFGARHYLDKYYGHRETVGQLSEPYGLVSNYQVRIELLPELRGLLASNPGAEDLRSYLKKHTNHPES